MSDELTFLPWLRRGLAQALVTPGPLFDPIARGPAVTASVDVLDEHAERDVRLHGPDHVLGLAAGQVLRSEPRPDSVEVETTLFPYVELAAPDLPWLYTPAAPGEQGIRPWLVLVVVREQEGVHLDLAAGGPPLLWIDEAVIADELPDLADAWAWAHVQSIVGLSGTAAAVDAGTREVVARLLCPRRLLPDSSWLACVVPAFDGGVFAGRGETVPAGTHWQAAWSHADNRWPGPLPVYHSWRFSTGQGGDFETLCRRLQPDDSGVEFGLRAMDVSDPGLMPPARSRVILDFAGALRTPKVFPRPWKPAKHQDDFQRAVADLLADSAVRADIRPPRPGDPYDPLTQDPVVGPPLYGQWPSGAQRANGEGWVPELNLDPTARAAAGLGARVVQAAQEELVAAAWDQAGSARATVAALNQGRLAVEFGRRLTGRVRTLDDGDVLHITAPLHALLGAGSVSIRSKLATSGVPVGVVSAAHLRLTRPGTPLARGWQLLTDSPRRLGSAHIETTVAASAEPESPALTFAAYGRLEAAQAFDPTLEGEPPALPAEQARIPRPRPRAREADPGPLGDPVPEDLPIPRHTTDVSGLAGDVIAALDPLAAVRASLVARIPALAGRLPVDTLPTTLALAPAFTDGLSDDLTRLGSSFVLPGAGALGRNRVRLVESDPRFAAIVLVGANHELARELLWRGYPVDLTATYFQRFWRYADTSKVDIEPIAGWTRESSIEKNLPDEALPMTVFVVRGDVVRRYPTAHYFLQKARLDGDEIKPVAGEVEAAAMRGLLDRDTLFVGFERPTAEVIGDRAGGDPGWLLAIEEQPAAPRFGLDDPPEPPDVPAYGQPPESWNDLSWANVAASENALDGLTHAPVDVRWLTRAVIEETTWGANSAHMARACHQQPFRVYFPGDQLD